MLVHIQQKQNDLVRSKMLKTDHTKSITVY